MKLLALDTSTEACSAALWIEGEVSERYALTPNDHGRHILGMVDALFGEAGVALASLDALAFGRGPGSFTGVRIAAAVVQGLALGADLPVVPVSSLAALSWGAYEEHRATAILAAIDARMNEVYWGCYCVLGEGLVEAQGEERVAPPAQVPLPASGRWRGVGSAWAAYGEQLAPRLGERLAGYDGDRYPRAADVAVLAAAAHARGGAVPVEQVTPVYLRDNVVHRR
jgi:tRNA threonylcarbamoyladenosine biosynthesis protein TsaB